MTLSELSDLPQELICLSLSGHPGCASQASARNEVAGPCEEHGNGGCWPWGGVGVLKGQRAHVPQGAVDVLREQQAATCLGQISRKVCGEQTYSQGPFGTRAKTPGSTHLAAGCTEGSEQEV